QFSCPGGESCCNGVCRNLVSDNQNCGTCANVCSLPANARDPVCVARVCSFTCNSGFTKCGNVCCSPGTICCNGTCTNVLSDVRNCGLCGNVCPSPTNSTPTCVGGTCAFVCNSGFSKCGNACCPSGPRHCDVAARSRCTRNADQVFNTCAGGCPGGFSGRNC